MSDGLTLKQKLFVDAYVGIAKGNATKAARLAGYTGNDNVLAVTGAENLRNPKIANAVSLRVSEYALSPEAVLAEIKAITEARITDLLEGKIYGKPTIALFEVDPETGELRPKQAAENLKKVTVTDESVAIEMYSRLEALVQLGKYHKLWTEKSEVSGPEGSPIPLRFTDMIVERHVAQTDTDEPLAD